MTTIPLDSRMGDLGQDGEFDLTLAEGAEADADEMPQVQPMTRPLFALSTKYCSMPSNKGPRIFTSSHTRRTIVFASEPTVFCARWRVRRAICHRALSARLKVMSQWISPNVGSPQDGRIQMKLSKNRAIDFRVNTLPTLFGEKIVLRILDPSSAQMGIDALGYEEEQKALYMDALSNPRV